MIYTSKYKSPIGEYTLAASDEGKLVGVWLKGQKYYMNGIDLEDTKIKDDDPILVQTKAWLDDYFAEKQPNFADLPLEPQGTDFQRRVWALLLSVPYGFTTTYGVMTEQMEYFSGEPASSQAIGGAVSKNPISIIIPCHRVVGADGSMVGYSGGNEAKEYLLAMERKSRKQRTEEVKESEEEEK